MGTSTARQKVPHDMIEPMMSLPPSSSWPPSTQNSNPGASILTEASLIAAVVAFVIVVMVVMVLAYIIQRLLKCAQFDVSRVLHVSPSSQGMELDAQRSSHLLEVRSRHISLASPHMSEAGESVRSRTPPPRYSEVAGSLPSYNTAIKVTDVELNEELQEQDSPADSVFLSSNTPGMIPPPPPLPPTFQHYR